MKRQLCAGSRVGHVFAPDFSGIPTSRECGAATRCRSIEHVARLRLATDDAKLDRSLHVKEVDVLFL